MDRKVEIENAAKRVLKVFGAKVKELLPQIVPMKSMDGVEVGLTGVLSGGREIPMLAFRGLPEDTVLTLRSPCTGDVKLRLKAAAAAITYIAMNQAMFALHGIMSFIGDPAEMPPSKDPLAEEIASVYFEEICKYIFHTRQFTNEERGLIRRYAD